MNLNIDITNPKSLKKISNILLNIWILYPLLMMFLTYKLTNEIARNIMFYLLNFIGISGIIIGITYYFVNKFKFNIRKNYIFIIGILLIIWLFITSLLSKDVFLSFIGEVYRKEGFQTYIYYSGVFILTLLLDEENKQIKLFNKLLFVEVIMAIIALLNNNLTHKLMYNQEPYTGIFSQFNHYGYYLMFGIIISIFLYLNNKKKIYKILYFLIYSFLTFMLILNDTFGCFLAVLISLFLMLFLFRKKILELIPIIIIFILLCIFTTRNNQNIVYKNFSRFFSDTKIVNDVVIKKEKKKTNNENNVVNVINSIGTSRGILWKYGLKYIEKKPIFGYGIEYIQELYHKNHIPQTRPHNIIIQMGVASGIPGIILYLIFILLIFYKSLKKINIFSIIEKGIFLMCICYFISSMFGNSMFYTSPYFITFLGILTHNTYLKNRENMIN